MHCFPAELHCSACLVKTRQLVAITCELYHRPAGDDSQLDLDKSHAAQRLALQTTKPRTVLPSPGKSCIITISYLRIKLFANKSPLLPIYQICASEIGVCRGLSSSRPPIIVLRSHCCQDYDEDYKMPLRVPIESRPKSIASRYNQHDALHHRLCAAFYGCRCGSCCQVFSCEGKKCR